jgi:hypothetical protein
MPKGLAVPVRVGPHGGAVTVEGSENDTKIIKTALGSDDNENAFQQNIGLGLDMIFDSNDAFSRIRIVARLQTIFERFEAQRRYKLREETLRWEEREGTGELVLTFFYTNLESDQEVEFQRSFTSAQSGVGGGDT